jgi:hypothetical protein
MIKELLSKGLKYSLDNPQEFSRIYKEVFGEVVCSYCPGIIQDKFNKLLNTTEKQIVSMKQRKWNIIKGKVIDTYMSKDGPWGHYTNDNITDEVAEKLILMGYGASLIRNNPLDEEVFIPAITEEINQPENNSDIKFEVFDRSEPAKDSFGTYSFDRLVKYCNSKGYDKKEWENLNRKNLIEYVRSK